MKSRSDWTACAAACAVGLATLGCAAEHAEGSGYVVLDRDARESGLGVEIDGLLETGVLPVEVVEGDVAAILGPELEIELNVEPNEVVIVTGADGALQRRRLRLDADPDRIDVDGTDRAAEGLAGELGGIAERVGATWRITAPDGFREAARLGPQAGLLELLPVDPSWSAPPPPVEAWGDLPPEAPVAAATGSPPGIAGSLDPSVSCDGVTGVWRGQQYLARQRGWYRFTLHIEPAGRDGGGLRGHILSHGWTGDVLDSTPPGLGGGSSRTNHWKVRMPASGAVGADGEVTFTGIDWSLEKRLGGWAPARPGDYCEDSFTGRVGARGLLHAENDDGCNPVSSIVFTRVACSDR